jgi:hypothetical protein
VIRAASPDGSNAWRANPERLEESVSMQSLKILLSRLHAQNSSKVRMEFFVDNRASSDLTKHAPYEAVPQTVEVLNPSSTPLQLRSSARQRPRISR